MEKHEVLTFEWIGGPLKNIPVPSFEPEPGGNGLVIQELSLEINPYGDASMDVTFTLSNGDHYSRDFRAKDFVKNVVDSMDPRARGSISIGRLTGLVKHGMGFRPESGVPLTKTLMEKYVLLLNLCGIDAKDIPAPRILRETIVVPARFERSLDVPYGKWLLEEVLEEQWQDMQIHDGDLPA